MSIKYDSINFIVDDRLFELNHIEQYEKGDLCGYITAILYDIKNSKDYEVLYRISDRMNGGSDNKIQAIDYGYELENSELVFFEAEKQLQNLVNTLDIDYQAIEQYQWNY